MIHQAIHQESIDRQVKIMSVEAPTEPVKESVAAGQSGVQSEFEKESGSEIISPRNQLHGNSILNKPVLANSLYISVEC
ncbi:MAG: hypothetical protein IPH88_18615 [Bacteroidales bacterium]|nr:hypothetical protein [Bacteroidales bacterium]